jgi:hypothetical protein
MNSQTIRFHLECLKIDRMAADLEAKPLRILKGDVVKRPHPVVRELLRRALERNR